MVSSIHLEPKTCCCGAPSPRDRVCNLQLLLVVVRSLILGFQSWRIHDWFIGSDWGLPILAGPHFTSRHWVPFWSPPTTRRARMEVFELATCSSLLMRKPIGKTALGRRRHGWVYNISTDCISLAQDTNQLWVLRNAVINFRSTWNVGKFTSSCSSSGFCKGLGSVKIFPRAVLH
jgi:hypothetical protein